MINTEEIELAAYKGLKSAAEEKSGGTSVQSMWESMKLRFIEKINKQKKNAEK